MLHWITHVVASLSYWGVAMLMAIENVVLPLPSEVIMPFAGFLSARGRMTLWGVILAGTIGSVLGALPLYYVARLVGKERLTTWIGGHGRWLLLRGRNLERATDRFERGAAKAVLIGQLLPGIRGLISLPAGFAKMNVALFAAANFLGTLLWCAVLASAGHVLGANYIKIHHFVGPLGWILLAMLMVIGAAWLQRRGTRR
jgi:membrane protein DedA with SNARE-associated domain